MLKWIRHKVADAKTQIELYIGRHPTLRSVFKWIVRFLKSGYGVLSVVIALTAIPGIKKEVHDWFISDEQLWKEKTYLNGIKIPLNINDDTQLLTIIIGSRDKHHYGLAQVFSLSTLSDTPSFSQQKVPYIIMPGGGTPFNLRFLLKGNRLYIGTIFKDIDDKYVGKMNFTEWELKSSKISNYHDGDDNMEIIDENGYVLFNMRYQTPNTIIIEGYYVSDGGVQIANDSTIIGINKLAPDYKIEAIQYIKGLKPLNNY
jgi:hypothetical protein